MTKLSRYMPYLTAGPGLTIIYPHAAEVATFNLQELTVRLQARLVELSSYGCKFACSDGAWAVSGANARVAYDAPTFDPTPALQMWQYKDY